MMDAIRSLTRGLSCTCLPMVYRALAPWPKLAFRYAAWCHNQATRRPRAIGTPDLPNLWCDNGSGVVSCCWHDSVARSIVMQGAWEPTITQTVSRLLSPGDVFIDIGAHIGHYALTGSRAVGEDGLVIAVEPCAENLESLAGMVVRNDLRNVSILGLGLGNSQAQARLYLGEQGNLGQTSRRPVSDRYRSALISPLPNVLSTELWERACLIKIDVEGAEHDVLKGMAPLMQSRPVPFLICEFIDSYLQQLGTSSKSTFETVESLGYSAFWIGANSNGKWTPVGDDTPFDQDLDLLWVHADAVSRLETLGDLIDRPAEPKSELVTSS